MARLELRTDGAALVPRQAPAVRHDREVRETFDLEDQIAVVLETDDPAGIFNVRALRLVAELTRDLSAVAGIDPGEITSLATERSRHSGRKALDFRTLLDPLPATAGELDRLRDEIAAMGIYTGTLVSRDGTGSEWRPTATAILIGVDPGVDRAALGRRIRAALPSDLAPEKVWVVGAPIAESLLGTHILEDLSTLVPIAVAIMGFLFFLRYRSWVAVLLPLTEVAACLLFVLGSMGHTGVPVSLVIIVMPVILTAVGIADEIHIFDRYAHLSREGGSTTVEAVSRTMDELWRPVVKTSVTTCVAFLSFAVSPIDPVRQFGLFTAAGVLFCMVWSLTVIPAGLVLTRPAISSAAAETWSRRLVRLGEGRPFSGGRHSGGRHSGGPRAGRPFRIAVPVMAGLAIVSIVSFGITRLVVQDSWIDGFAESSSFRRATETVNRLFFGTHLLFVSFDTRPAALAGELRTIRRSSSGPPERLELWTAAAAGLRPEALVGEQVAVRATPGERPDRRQRANLVATVRTASRQAGGLRLEMDLVLDASRRRFLASRPGPWSFFATGERLLDPGMLDQIRRIGVFISDRLSRRGGDGAGGGVLVPAAQIAVVRELVRGPEVEGRRVGETALENRYLLSVLGRVRGEKRVEEIIDATRRQALLTVFLDHPDFVAVGRLMNDIRGYARAELTGLGVRVGFAGDVAVSQAMIGAIVSTQIRSLLLSLAGIFVVAAWLGRSARLGLLCLLPPALAVLINFSLMGVLGIPLGVATSMFSAMTLGIGVDFAIHLTERCRFLSATLPDLRERRRESLAVTAPAILMNTLVVAAGFGTMALSPVPANRRLGLLVVSGIVTCLVATLFLLPRMMSGDDPRASRPR